MSVSLLPPLTRSGGFGYAQADPLAEGPAYILGRPSPRYEPRWHRVRSGLNMRDFDGGRTTIWLAWCGPHHYADNVVAVDQLPDGHLLCGTCDGRAKGHAGTNGLIFSPDAMKAPKTCPSKTLYDTVGYNVGRCLACGELAPLRASGGPYNCREVITAHPPLRLVPGCEFHAWRQLVRSGDAAACSCRTDNSLLASPEGA